MHQATDASPPALEHAVPALSGRALPTPADPQAVASWIVALCAGALVSGLVVHQAPGLGSVLASLVVVGAWKGVALARARSLQRGEVLALVALVVLGAIPVLRASPWLLTYTAMAFTLVVLSLPVLARRRASRTPGLVVVRELLDALGAATGGAALSARDELSVSGIKSRLRTPLIGMAIGLPVATIFLAFFASADAVFASLIARVFTTSGSGSHAFTYVLVAAVIAWVTVGLTRRAGQRADAVLPREGRTPLVGASELLIGVLIVDALFVAFVSVQLMQIAGFADALSVPGVTYANAAREGFFQLLAVTALVAVGAPAAHLLGGQSRRVRLALTALLALTACVAASALWRMSLYTDAYGLTELRFHASALMVWLVAMLGWLHWSVLQARGAVLVGVAASLFVSVVVLAAVNPDARIAAVNLARGDVDAYYLHELSDDAAPTLGASEYGPVCEVVRIKRERARARLEAWPVLSWSWARAAAASADCTPMAP